MSRIISGKAVAKQLEAQLLKCTIELQNKYKRVPSLRVIIVGNNPASISYVRGKEKTAKRLGFDAETIRLAADCSKEDLLDTIAKLNKDSKIDGILLQLPLPGHLDPNDFIERIDSQKDVDGLHPTNAGRLALGLDTIMPCTPHGILRLLAAYDIETTGQNVVILGRSSIVGIPMATMLMQKALGNATVTVAHTATLELREHCRQADIIIVAAGQKNLLTADMVKSSVVIIDVGVNRIEDPRKKNGYRLVGDVDFASLALKARAISPVPGGVGPMTIAMLMYNTLEVLCRRYSINDIKVDWDLLKQ